MVCTNSEYIMNKILTIFALWFSVISFAIADAPTAEITVKAVNTTFPAQYQINFTVPPEHHAYLDKGDEQMYIPITFDGNGALAGGGLKIEKLDKPLGVYDSEVKATVLRATGEFNLTLSGAANTAIFPLSVKYQICNDTTKQCFRPQTVSVDLKLPTNSVAKKLNRPIPHPKASPTNCSVYLKTTRTTR